MRAVLRSVAKVYADRAYFPCIAKKSGCVLLAYAAAKQTLQRSEVYFSESGLSVYQHSNGASAPTGMMRFALDALTFLAGKSWPFGPKHVEHHTRSFQHKLPLDDP